MNFSVFAYSAYPMYEAPRYDKFCILLWNGDITGRTWHLPFDWRNIHSTSTKMTIGFFGVFVCFYRQFGVLFLFFFFFNKDPEDFLSFNSMGYGLQQGYEEQRHFKAFEQISSAPIPTAGHPHLNLMCTPCIIYQLIYIS